MPRFILRCSWTQKISTLSICIERWNDIDLPTATTAISGEWLSQPETGQRELERYICGSLSCMRL
jgi:hypothetical protein